MESTETINHILHPLENGHFIDEVELSHTAGKDFWLGRAGSENRMWLSNEWDEAVRLAMEKIG